MVAPSDELEYLKSLVSQLNEKIASLEAKAKDTLKSYKTPVQQLRTVLVGPPGAGEHRKASRSKEALTVLVNRQRNASP
jgi:adenylate kinase